MRVNAGATAPTYTGAHGCARSWRSPPPRGDRRRGRHLHRVVRLLPLQHRDGAGVRAPVFSSRRSAGRHARLARPVGAAIFGHYGDRLGRKAALIATLLLMGVATFLVALVPTYARIGIWGAVILTTLRFIQGIGVGGEWGGSVLLSMEWAQSNRHRGFIASWPQFGVSAGLFLSNLEVLAMSAASGEKFLTWGWRVPFLFS